MPQGLQEEYDQNPGGSHLHTNPRPGSRTDTYQSGGQTGNTRTIPPPPNTKECKRAGEHSTFTQPAATAPSRAVGSRTQLTNLPTGSETDLEPLQPTADSR